MQRASNETKRLTEVELELMNVLWRLGEGSVKDVLEALPNDRKLAYTSVSTIMRILEQKQVLKARKEGRGHIYFPRLTKSQYEATALKHVVQHVFDGTPVSLIKQLLGSYPIDAKDLKEIKSLIERAGNKK